jgi:hypothetical protein
MGPISGGSGKKKTSISFLIFLYAAAVQENKNSLQTSAPGISPAIMAEGNIGNKLDCLASGNIQIGIVSLAACLLVPHSKRRR